MSRRRRVVAVVMMALALLLVPAAVGANGGFDGPLFGLGTDAGGGVLVADAGYGVNDSLGADLAFLPGITDVAASDQGYWWAITGLPDARLYKVSGGVATEFADLGAYEAKYDPHPAEIDSNPFSVVDLGGGEAVVADAGGNTLLKVNKHGKVKLIAVLPDELVPTDNAKAIVEEIVGASCSDVLEDPESLPEEIRDDAVGICSLPPMIPAEPVATSVAIGPDGDFYVGELKGFPAPTGESKVWRIRRNARNADCSISPLCSVAHDGFTSIVDLAFGADDTLYVAEMDEKSWFAVELAVFDGLPVTLGGGTINACTGACVVEEGSIDLLSALTVDGDGDLWYAQLFGPVTEIDLP